MHWLGLICFAGSAAVVIRWIPRRVDSLGRRRSFPIYSAGFLVVLGCAFLTPWVLRVWLEERLSDAASVFVGQPVEVNCQSFGEAFVDTRHEFGYVAFGPDGVPERKTLIKRQQCRDLRDYLSSDKEAPTREHVIAVHTLTHEAVHMSGVTVEAATECQAVQRDAEMARLLGAPAAGAERLAALYRETIYPQMPEAYRSENCRFP